MPKGWFSPSTTGYRYLTQTVRPTTQGVSPTEPSGQAPAAFYCVVLFVSVYALYAHRGHLLTLELTSDCKPLDMGTEN